MLRSAIRAISRLCVTTITTRPSFARLQRLQDLYPGPEVELPGGLIGEQDRVAGGERTRDRNALLLAAGELVGEVLNPLAQPDALQTSATSRGCRVRPRPNSTFSGRQRWEQIERLKYEATVCR
jgi:hypothetical protein